MRRANAGARIGPHAPRSAPLPGRPGPYRALVRPPKARHIEVIDQRALPHAVVKVKIADADAAALAIRRMWSAARR